MHQIHAVFLQFHFLGEFIGLCSTVKTLYLNLKCRRVFFDGAVEVVERRRMCAEIENSGAVLLFPITVLPRLWEGR